MGHTESNNIMKRKIIFSGLAVAVVIVATALVVMQRADREQETGSKDQMSEVRNRKTEAIRQNSEAFKQKVLASPEEFQMTTVIKREAPVPLTVPTERPTQLSEVTRLETESRSPEAEKKPVAVSDLYFHEDYQSMRKEEISNPDSEENRAGVVALLQARQRRASRD